MEYRIVNGLKIYNFTSRAELISFVAKEKRILIAINSKKIKQANDNIRDIVNCNIGYVDGFGAQIALKQKNIKKPLKIPGCELWLDIINEFYKTETFYLIGGREEVIEKVVEKLKIDFPGIDIVNFRNGYISTDAERKALIEDIKNKKPTVVFVAMGSPIQEYLMQDMHKVHPAIYQGLGGSFDVYTGTVKRAPKWIADNGLEGVYRAFREPRKRLVGVLSDVWFYISIKLGRF